MKEGAKCLENDPLGIKILLIYDGGSRKYCGGQNRPGA